MDGGGVLVTVGTDHHPFDRLVGWADRWAAAHPTVPVFVQCGRSRPPRHAAGASQLAPADLQERIRTADVVVAQAGPGGIAECRAAGRRPVVLPRDPTRGEHVDDHQLRFAAFLAERGLISLADGAEQLDELVGAALVDPAAFRVDPRDSPTLATALALDRRLHDLVAGPRLRRPDLLAHPRRRGLLRRRP